MEDLKKLLDILHNRLEEIRNKENKSLNEIEEYKDIQQQCIKIQEIMNLLKKFVF